MNATKKDVFFCIITLLLAGCFCIGIYFAPHAAASTLVVFHDSVEIAMYDLRVDREVDVSVDGDFLHLVIKNGTVSVSASDCAGQDCVHAAPISKAGQSILCAPQRILLRLVADGAPDAVVK